MNSSIRTLCFTRFFDNEALAVEQAERLDFHLLSPLFRYGIVNVERAPTTGAIHWQGYLELTESRRWPQIIQEAPILVGAHWEKRKGTQQQAIDYCKKVESQIAGPFEHGSPAGARGAGKVTAQTIVDYIAENPDMRMEDVAAMFPAYCMMHYDKVQAHLLRSKQHVMDDSAFEPRAWQQHVLAEMRKNPDDRHIMWVTDMAGGKGKSRLARHLTYQHGAVSLSGKIPDMALIYRNNQSRIAMFDVSRGEKDFSDHVYSFAENLKNGAVVSSKYQSESLRFPAPHVIVFSNKSWDRSMWTVDRVIEFDLSDPRWTIPPLPEVVPEVEEVLSGFREEGGEQLFDEDVMQELFRDFDDAVPADNMW